MGRLSQMLSCPVTPALDRPTDWQARANFAYGTRFPAVGKCGDLFKPGRVRGDGMLDPGGAGLDLGGQRFDPVEHHAQHERTIAGEMPGQDLRMLDLSTPFQESPQSERDKFLTSNPRAGFRDLGGLRRPIGWAQTDIRL